jgi:putative peptidoglycan lipid II flippase
LKTTTARSVNDRSGHHALLVAAGILLSRTLGLIRQWVTARYLGTGMAAGALAAAMRIPNFLQNLFGEGVLSASFIPAYSRLLKEDPEEADRLAGAVFGLLAAVTAVIVAGGVVATPVLIDLISPGFEGEARELTIRLVRILFPGTGMLVMAAWCLGVLNSHRRFFLSYAAPVAWNVAIIGALLLFRGDVIAVAWGTVVGCGLQILVQLPAIRGLIGRFRPSLSLRQESTRQVVRSFGPVFVGRGVVQISAFVDTAYASLISSRAMAVLGYAQTVYLLPLSLFGMAISAAELPAMAQASETGEALRQRMSTALGRMSFFVVPSAVAFGLLGDVVAGSLLQTGAFTGADTRITWYMLIGAGIGLLYSTRGRLLASAFYALRDTRTPLKFAVVRVALAAAGAYYCVRVLPEQLGLPADLGTAGITATSAIAGSLEYLLLRRALKEKLGGAVPVPSTAKLWLAALVSAALGLGIKLGLTRWGGPDPAVLAEWGGGLLPAPALSPVLTAALVLGPFGVAYFLITYAMKVPQSEAVLGKVLRRLRRS